MVKLGLTILSLVALTIGALSFRSFRDEEPLGPVFQLAEVTRGEVVKTVSASGTLRAVVTVNVGAQVSGMVAALHADFNSEVTEGEVIGRIDAAPFEARHMQAQAELDVAKASLKSQTAMLESLVAEVEGHQAALARYEADLARQEDLRERGSATDRAIEAVVAAEAEARATFKAATARISMQQAQIDLAMAEVAKREAVVRLREIEMENTLIRSPVDGVVVNRNVDVGQIVAATLEAPTLFQIAQDLSLMQLNIRVDEADIGRVEVGQNVNFTVDAYPSRRFSGTVSQVRKAGLSFSNVVTYTVVARLENPDLLLLPGMTADANIETRRAEGVLRVPTSAFYFSPPGTERGTDWKVWVLGEGGVPEPLAVEFGLYDDNYTEILGGLVEGQEVITNVDTATREKPSRWLPFQF